MIIEVTPIDPVHIRIADNTTTYCGDEGGSISLRHYRQQPHALGLPLCERCLALLS